MADQAGPSDGSRISSIEDRMPSQRLGVAVVEALVGVIVSGEIAPGETLPPEAPLSRQFGVSRTVLRESVKRLEEKGLVAVGQGRGTVVLPTRSWNMLDRVVLTALIANDDSLGVLDELSIVRARLEAAMAGETARTRSAEQLAALREILEAMRSSVDDPTAFGAADVQFHELVMEISGNRLAESIARVLFERARESARYVGMADESIHVQTLREHEAVLATIEAATADAAEQAMYAHITEAWQRRRLPDHGGKKPRRKA